MLCIHTLACHIYNISMSERNVFFLYLIRANIVCCDSEKLVNTEIFS